MLQSTTLQTGTGGLILLLLVAGCSAGSHTRTTAKHSPGGTVVAEGRSSPDDRTPSYDPTDRMTRSDRMTARTERPIPGDRTGSSDLMPSDRVVPCADDKGDMTASMDCAPRTRDRASDPSAGVVAACSYRMDDKGTIVYDDPNCPPRYRRQMGSSYENVRWTQENAFYDRHANAAVRHAREAEIAGNQGHTAEMLRHAELALDRAKEAQRAGNHPDLNEGIIALRDTLTLGAANRTSGAVSSIRDARINLSRAAGMQTTDTRTRSEMATRTSSAVGTPRVVKGELIQGRSSSSVPGDGPYFLRDRNGTDTPISLSPDMSRHVQAGDVVEAQIDSTGQVLAISKLE